MEAFIDEALTSKFLRHSRYAFSQAFRTIIPRPEDRTPITFNAVAIMLACYLPFVFMTYLARREGTHLIRILLLPSVIISSLWSSYTYYWNTPILNVFNWGQCLSSIVVVGKAIEYAFTPEGILKVDEIKAGVSNGKIVARDAEEKMNGCVKRDSVCAKSGLRFPLVAPWLSDVIELSHSMRGLRFKFGHDVYTPKDKRPMERGPFLKATARSFVVNFLVLDLLETILKLFPGVGSVSGGSMFYDLPMAQRYAVSTAVHLITGSSLLAGFQMVYTLITMIAIGLFHDSPTFWPPVIENPWLAESMHQLWSRRWHQLLRQTFYVYGGYLGRKVAGNVGMVFGMFLASGLFHEVGMYGMGRDWNWAPVLFFASQGPILVLERVWRKITGRRVGGWPGRLWVYFIMFILAQPMINSWHQRGLGGGFVIPPFLSPVRISAATIIELLHY